MRSIVRLDFLDVTQKMQNYSVTLRRNSCFTVALKTENTSPINGKFISIYKTLVKYKDIYTGDIGYFKIPDIFYMYVDKF